MPASSIIALDLGTTAAKGLLISGETVISRASATYPLEVSAAGRAEQDPDLIVARAAEVIMALVTQSHGNAIDAISISSAMHSLIVLDAGGAPLTASITWADRTAARQAEILRASPEGMALYLRTGTPIHPMAWPAKLQHLAQQQPELFASAAKFIGIKEYLLLHLTGQMPCDHSLASATGMFNLDRLDWDDEALALTGMMRGRLPELCRTTDTVLLGRRGAKMLNLGAQTPIVVGAGDGCLSNLGAGAIDPGVAALTIGTSGALRTAAPRPVTDPLMRTFCYVLTEGCFITGGAVNGGGMALQWARDHLGFADASEHQDDFDALLAAAGSVSAGSDGLMFHPYLSGERAPLWRTDASASFIGLTMVHDRRHMARAVAEGIFLNLYQVLEALEAAASTPIRRILAVGGFTRSAFLQQMLADVFGRQIEFPADRESSALGAAKLAQIALGDTDISTLYRQASLPEFCCDPDNEVSAVYQRMHSIYGSIPQLMGSTYRELATLRTDTSHSAKS